MRAIIIEDEANSIENLKNMLAANTPEVEVIGVAKGISEGLHLLQEEDCNPELAFLDINLSDGKVFQLLNQLDQIDFEIIFVTAYDQFAQKACEYGCVGYITKPIDPEELISAVARAQNGSRQRMQDRLEIVSSYMQNDNPNPFRKIIVPAMEGMYFLQVDDIIYLEGDDNCTHFHLRNGEKVMVTKTIKKYDDLLEPLNFFRIHKSHLINMNHLAKYVKGDGGFVILDNGAKLELSRRRRTAFQDKLKKLQDRFTISL